MGKGGGDDHGDMTTIVLPGRDEKKKTKTKKKKTYLNGFGWVWVWLWLLGVQQSG